MTGVDKQLSVALEDRYRLGRKVGAGGMAEVYLAEDLKHRRDVAVKVLGRELSTSLAAERFLREIEIASRLTHPHILPLYDSGVAEQTFYYVMPYVEGESLGQRMARDGKLSLDFALQITREVASALDYAHRQGVVHRDIKPDNILLADDHAVVMDFGIARAVGEAGGYNLTQAGFPLGTPKYMSPEQALGVTEVDGRSDIHSLARVVYEMLVGEPPARPCDRECVDAGRFTNLPPHHAKIFELVPDRVVRGLVRALAERPENRFTAAADFAAQMGPPQRDTRTWSKDNLPPASEPATKSVLPHVLLGAAVLAAVAGFVVFDSVIVAVALAGVLAPSAFVAFTATRRPTFRSIVRRRQKSVSGARWQKTQRTSSDVIESVAVLPFADMSPNHDQEYFSDGIAEELLNALAKIHGLRVAARTSSFHFKGKNVDVREIGEKLGVVSILEGSIRKSANRVRITAQLVNAEDGFHLWSETFDRELEDVFEVQQEIADCIVNALRIQLPGDPPRTPTQDVPAPKAHDLYLLGRFHWNKRTKDDLIHAADYFRQAVDHDPAYAAAHAGLADAHLLLGTYQYVPPAEALPRAKAAVARALELDENLAEAHATRGQILRSELDWIQEEGAYKTAIRCNANYATAHQWYATALAARGRQREALKEIRRAEEIDPLSAAIGVTSAIILVIDREYEGAIHQLRKVRELAPDFVSLHAWWSLTHACVGKFEEAIEAADRAQQISRWTGLSAHAMVRALVGRRDEALQYVQRIDAWKEKPLGALAVVHAVLGDAERAIDDLDEIFAEEGWSFFTMHRAFLLYVNVLPWFDPVRNHPRFPEIVSRLNFPPTESANQ